MLKSLAHEKHPSSQKKVVKFVQLIWYIETEAFLVAEQVHKKATLPSDVNIDFQSPFETGGLSERKWRRVDILQHSSP